MGFVILLVFLVLIVGLVVHVEFVAVIAGFTLALYAGSRAWLRWSVRGLQFEHQFSDRALCGDTVPVALTVTNTSRLPIPWLDVWESMTLDLGGTSLPPRALSLRPGETRHFQYEVRCKRRGSHPIGPLWAEAGDVLGIERRRLTIHEPRRLTVYPRIVPLERLGLPTRSACAAIPSSTALFEDPTSLVGVRDYRPGDAVGRMHWRATARIGRPVVKQFQPAASRDTMICLDLNANNYPFFWRHSTEMAIVVAASVANHIAVRDKLPVGLATEAKDESFGPVRRITLAPRSGRPHLMSVLEALSHSHPATRTHFADLLRQVSANLSWGSTVLIITGSIDAALTEAALALRSAGCAVSVVVVRPPSLQLHLPHSLPGVAIHRVWDDADLEALA